MTTTTSNGVLARAGRTGRRAALTAVAATAALALLAGCGGDDEPDAASASPTASASASASGAATGDSADAKDVRAAYVAFEKAGADQDTAELATLISASTLEYFDTMRGLALDAPKAALEKQRVVDQITVLGMRAKVDPKILRDGTPQDLLEASAGGGASVPSTGLADKAAITVDGDKATAADPANPAQGLTFVKEGGAWKADVTSIFGQLEQSVAPMVQASGGDKGAFVEQSLAGQVGGPEKAKALWTPVGR